MPSASVAADSQALTPSLCCSELPQHCALHCSHWHCGMKGNDVCGAFLQKEVFFFFLSFFLFFNLFFYFFARGRTLQCRAGAAKVSAAPSPCPQCSSVPSAGSDHAGHAGHTGSSTRAGFVSPPSSPAAREVLLWAELPSGSSCDVPHFPFGSP